MTSHGFLFASLVLYHIHSCSSLKLLIIILALFASKYLNDQESKSIHIYRYFVLQNQYTNFIHYGFNERYIYYNEYNYIYIYI